MTPVPKLRKKNDEGRKEEGKERREGRQEKRGNRRRKGAYLEPLLNMPCSVTERSSHGPSSTPAQVTHMALCPPAPTVPAPSGSWTSEPAA